MWWILLLAVGLRLINLNQPLWLDEAFQFKAISAFSLKDMLTVYLAGDFNPPLSYLINFFIGNLIGYSEIALRLPAVIFGVMTVFLVYRLGGKWPALLLAVSGLHIYYSQEARMYSLAALAVTASWYFLKQRQWVGYALAGLAAIYSHYLTVFIFPAQLLLVKKADLKKLFLAWLGIGLGFLPWLSVFLKQLEAGVQTSGTAWGGVVGGLSFKALVLIPVKFLIGRIALENNLLYILILVLPLMIAGWLLIRAISRKNLFYLSWLFVPLVLIILVSIKLPVLAYFRLLFLLPAVYLLISIRQTRPTRSLLVGLVIFNLGCSLVYLLNANFHREDWRGLAKNIVTDKPVAIIPAVNAPLKYYYSGRITDQEIPEGEEFWYVAYAEPIFDPELNFRQQVAAAGWQVIGEQHFRGNLTLIQYKR